MVKIYRGNNITFVNILSGATFINILKQIIKIYKIISIKHPEKFMLHLFY